MYRLLIAAAVVVLLAPALDAEAGTIEDQIRRVDNGRLTMTFDSRDGVCGNGRGSVSFGRHHLNYRHRDNIVIHDSDDGDWWDYDCEEGPVHVMLRVRDGDVTRVRTRVGGGWHARDGVTDIGVVAPGEAAEFLLALARTGRSDAAEDAILPALLARDVVVWPELLEIARDRSVASDVRRSSVFWLGQLAGEKATEGLVALVDDDDVELEVRKSAVFALSQQDNSESIDELVEIAMTNRHPQLRRQALFWLAQSDDPRVLNVFEDILTDSR